MVKSVLSHSVPRISGNAAPSLERDYANEIDRVKCKMTGRLCTPRMV